MIFRSRSPSLRASVCALHSRNRVETLARLDERVAEKLEVNWRLLRHPAKLFRRSHWSALTVAGRAAPPAKPRSVYSYLPTLPLRAYRRRLPLSPIGTRCLESSTKFLRHSQYLVMKRCL